GRTHNGCCPVPIIYEVTDFNPPYQSLTLSATDWRSAEPVTLQNHTDTLFALQDACATAIATVVSSIHICQGDVWAYNGQVYTAPGTVRDTVYNPSGGCDTVFVYNLVQIPQPFLVNTLSTCPGSEIVLNGITYTQPDTISIMLPATSGCDTLLVVFLRFDQWPKKYQITTFCPGDTVFLNGWHYTFPGIVFPPDTIPGPPNGCDTLLFQKLEYPSVPSEVTVICPENIWAQTAPGNTVPVFFDIPQAETTCPCDVLDIWQASGLPSGAGFPAGVTELCFWANDICGAYSPCCFTVNVEEIAACDTKQSGPVLFELLDISSEPNGDLTYRMRIRNESNAPVAYVAFALPEGANALTPLNGSTYQTLAGRDYLVKNPNAAPFKSIRFKADDPVLSNGLEDIFAYTIPAQYGISFVQSIVKLTNGAFYEAKLNTFGCADAPNRPDSRGISVENPNQTFTVFPNPSNGQIAVQWSTGMACCFVLRNELGQEVARYSSVSGANMEILQFPATLANGMYLLEMFTGNGERQSLWFQLER
ncbi:MAG: HYR domain-containing protein, partial [Saprospiraceae bacterium]|nr:HYR domain-containing protein [Saprospiraceae bacterium]